MNLTDWQGDSAHESWNRLTREVEVKLTPRWVQQQLRNLEAQLISERARRESAEHRDKALQMQLKKEIQEQDDLNANATS